MKPKPGTIVTSIQTADSTHGYGTICVVVDIGIANRFWSLLSLSENRIWVSKFNNMGIERPYWISPDRFYLNYLPSGQLSGLEQLLYGIYV